MTAQFEVIKRKSDMFWCERWIEIVQKKDGKAELRFTKHYNQDYLFMKGFDLKNEQLSRGEICVENFIPPANGASLGFYFRCGGGGGGGFKNVEQRFENSL